MNTSLAILLFIALVLVAAKVSGSLSARFGMPIVLGELIAGVLLGPSFLNLWRFSWLSTPVAEHAASPESIVKVLAEIGVVLLMFMAGLETDAKMMRNAVGPAFWAAVGGVVLPMAGGCFLSRQFGLSWQESIFIGTILTATSVTITAQTLMNLSQMKSRAGATILGAAVIDDVLGLIVLSLVIAIAPQMAHAGPTPWTGLAITIGRMLLCVVALFWLGPYLTRWLLKRAARMHGHHTEVAAALVLALFLAFFAEWLGGMAAITGAYLAGLFISVTSSRENVVHELSPMVNSFFGPLFFISVGLEVNIWSLNGKLIFFVLLTAIAIFGKIFGSGFAAYWSGLSRRESLAVGVGMIPRGEVGLITASLGLSSGLVTRDVYVQAVVLVLVSTLITPALLRYTFTQESLKDSADGYKLPTEQDRLASISE
jgi:Kef-type K+ transport system membrane component KefB